MKELKYQIKRLLKIIYWLYFMVGRQIPSGDGGRFSIMLAFQCAYILETTAKHLRS